jgi:hypothetical protein
MRGSCQRPETWLKQLAETIKNQTIANQENTPHTERHDTAPGQLLDPKPLLGQHRKPKADRQRSESPGDEIWCNRCAKPEDARNEYQYAKRHHAPAHPKHRKLQGHLTSTSLDGVHESQQRQSTSGEEITAHDAEEPQAHDVVLASIPKDTFTIPSKEDRSNAGAEGVDVPSGSWTHLREGQGKKEQKGHRRRADETDIDTK